MATYDFSAAFSQLGDDTPQTLLELLKLYLGIDPGDNTEDEELSRALNFAGDAIETYLDRVVAKRPIDEYFAHHFGVVVLHNMPTDLNAPINVFLNGHQQTDYKPFLGRGKMCFLTRQGMRPDMPMDWRAFDQVTVTYTAGFDPIPSDLAYAICMTAALFYQAEGTGNPPGGGGGSGAVKSVTVYDVGSVSYDVGSTASGSVGSGVFGSNGVIPDTAAEMLTRYKRIAA